MCELDLKECVLIRPSSSFPQSHAPQLLDGSAPQSFLVLYLEGQCFGAETEMNKLEIMEKIQSLLWTATTRYETANRIILINQSISVSSQTQFFEIVSSKSVVKSSFGKFFLRWIE